VTEVELTLDDAPTGAVLFELSVIFCDTTVNGEIVPLGRVGAELELEEEAVGLLLLVVLVCSGGSGRTSFPLEATV